MGRRSREIEVKVRFTQEEMSLVEERMKLVPTKNREAFLRKMATDGFMLVLDMTEIRQLTAQISRCGNNLNQIARRLNESGRIYEFDLVDILRQQDEINTNVRTVVERLGKYA